MTDYIMDMSNIFLVGVNAVRDNNPDVMYTKLITAGVIILMLLVIKFSSNTKTTSNG